MQRMSDNEMGKLPEQERKEEKMMSIDLHRTPLEETPLAGAEMLLKNKFTSEEDRKKLIVYVVTETGEWAESYLTLNMRDQLSAYQKDAKKKVVLDRRTVHIPASTLELLKVK